MMHHLNRETQRARIRDLLVAAHGDWVPLPQIMKCAAQYNARIHELRRMGVCIPPPRTETINGQKHTWYRIEFGETLAQRDEGPLAVPARQTFPEFGSLSPERRYPD